ncbi:hypothetical protein [Marinobacter confluentis]|uniref:Uncharacterized protein n=1 Tax=Marinobacter confluentis TaxID=1697557 RepID=A0A4Z1C0D0_9GAMM|nr:hypothetical protein [Marinobacter confluentis]TGN38199.1 hypothetical protein E5Q11_16625 [Marinobacter confluentis]
MIRLLPVSTALFLLPFLLIGCGDESDSLPADGRDFDAEGYIAGKPYTGRVIDGYLENARVWLDLDGDGQHTSGPLLLQTSAGVEVELPGGEPTAMTAADGRFSLDVSELEQDPSVSPDLDPRDYPLMALALPGQTIEHTGSGQRVLEQAFMISAPPGIRNVTPLTTLVRQRRVNGIGEFLVGTSDLALALGNINLVSDFVRSGDERAQAYASAFARFLSSQLPQDYKDILRDGDGTERFLSAEAVRLMGISFARNALSIVQIVDEAAIDGDYAGIDIKSLVLPEIELELDDSVIVSSQKVFARAASGLPSSFIGLDALAEMDFRYAEDGRLTAVVTNGCMTPSLAEMVRLINADGKIAATGTQWIPALSLNQNSGTFYDQEGVDERLTFDWNNGTAAFETTTTCHAGLADASEFGGPPEISYEWTLTNGRVTSLTATSNNKTEVLTPDYAFSTDFVVGSVRNVDNIEEEVIDLLAQPQSCAGDIMPEDADEPQVVSAVQPFTVTGDLPIPSGFSNLRLELDTRDGLFRPLRYPVLNEEFQTTEGVSNSTGFEWNFYYPTEASGDLILDQPNLIKTAYLARYDGQRSCGRDFGSTPASSYARVEYSYQRLSEFLAGQIQ